MTDDDDFDAVIDSAYAEPLMITGAIGDDDLTQVAPTPPRPGVDLGDAGSLVQARDQLRRRHSAARGPLTRDQVTITASLTLLASAVGVGTIIGGAKIPGPTILAVLLVPALLVILAGSALVLVVRYGPTAADRNLSATITAEQRAGRELTAALAGSPWVVLHDRRLPLSEHRVPFIAVGPAGIAVISVLPAGPYLILSPSGVKAGEDELAYGWLPARIWEARYLMRNLSNVGTAGLRFAGPVMPMAMEGYPRATKMSEGWSAQPPYRIDRFPIRRPAVLSQYLNYLPRIFAPHHVTQLVQLVDQQCPPAPTPPAS